LAIHLFVTIVKFLHPGGVRAVAAESPLLKQQHCQGFFHTPIAA
jgi:hypothetical protein